jgi:RNA polymerase sigma factor (sigma-70 family)
VSERERCRLTIRQERELVVAAERGDPDACRRLVEAFLPAIRALAHSYHGVLGIERQELLQEGVAGLLVAARRYDPLRQTRFWTYASFWVRKAMQELVAELGRPVALSDRAVRGLAQLRAAQRAHVQAHGREPTREELCRATGLAAAQIDALHAVERRPRGLEERVGGDEAGATVAETIVDPDAGHAYDELLDALERSEVRRLVERLDERERLVVRAHYGLDCRPLTLSQIGGTLGLTGERARQIEAAALEKLRAIRAA